MWCGSLESECDPRHLTVVQNYEIGAYCYQKGFAIRDQTSLDILNLLYRISSNHRVRFQWVPSYVGIDGYEKADLLARTAHVEEVSPTGAVTFSELYSLKKIEFHHLRRNPGGQKIFPERHLCYSEFVSSAHVLTCSDFKTDVVLLDTLLFLEFLDFFWIHGDYLALLDYLGLEATTTTTRRRLLDPGVDGRGKEGSLVVFVGGKRGIVSDGRKWDSLSDKATTGRGPAKMRNYFYHSKNYNMYTDLQKLRYNMFLKLGLTDLTLTINFTVYKRDKTEFSETLYIKKA
ncbi:UNVERIFIED_CONTAM: hypothetical protein NCL1_35343 [Trichonephila clavipes]